MNYPDPRAEEFLLINQRTHYFALNPNILIELSSPHKLGKHVKRKTFYGRNMEDLHKITDFNITRVRYSDGFAYSPTKNELQELIKFKK